MRFTALALLLVVANSYCQATRPATVQELIKMADEAGANFTTVALERMNNTELWGAKRAKKTIDIVIMNKSGTLLGSPTPICSLGSLVSPGLVPEDKLDAHTSTVLGLQSGKDDQLGYVDCELAYYGVKMSSFIGLHVHPRNVRGKIRIDSDDSPEFFVHKHVRKGEVTQIIITVMDQAHL